MNLFLILPMAPTPGATPAETRQRLLRAAADVFAERGYDGTRVADIAAAAGVSNGAMYAHFASKAELLVGALRAHARRLLAELFAADPDRSVTDLLLAMGRWLPRRRDARGYLIVEALVAARRDKDVARPVRGDVGERGGWLGGPGGAGPGRRGARPGPVPAPPGPLFPALALGSAADTPGP